MKGRRPRPTHIKLLEGEKNKDRINYNEPKPAPKIPRPPKHLSKLAKKEFRRAAKMLHKCGVMTEIDDVALAAYAQHYAHWIEAQEMVNAKGVLVLSPKNKVPMQNPGLSIAQNSMREMMRILIDFGMTPSSRSKIVVNPKKANTKMESLID